MFDEAMSAFQRPVCFVSSVDFVCLDIIVCFRNIGTLKT